MSYEYIRGLIDGEGCFTFCTVDDNKKQEKLKIPTFALRMHVRDEELIRNVRNTLKLKDRVHVYHYPGKDGANRGPQAFIMVRSFGSLKNIIIPLFYKKLHGHKGVQFMAWLEKIGADPLVPESYRLLYRLHKSGFYDRNPKF